MMDEQKNEITVALIQKDIEYIKQSAQKIDQTLTIFDRDFARRSELKIIEDAMTKFHKDMEKALEHKVDNSEFLPIKNTLYRINWLVISSVVVGLLALLVSTVKSF